MQRGDHTFQEEQDAPTRRAKVVNCIALDYMRDRRLKRHSLSSIDGEHNYIALLAAGDGNCILSHFQDPLRTHNPRHPIGWERIESKHSIVPVQKKDVDWKFHLDGVDCHQGKPTAPGNKESFAYFETGMIQ